MAVRSIGLSVVLLLAACQGAAAVSADELIGALIEKTQAADRTMHVDVRTRATSEHAGSAATVVIEGSFDFSGEDFAGTTSMRMAGGFGGPMVPHQTEIIHVDGQDFVRDSFTNEWTREHLGAAHSFPGTRDPLAGLAREDLELVTDAEGLAEGTYLLRAVNPRPLLMRQLGPQDPGMMGEFYASGAAYEILVDREGTPLVVAMQMSGTPTGDFIEEMRMSMSIEYRISSWGAPVTIQPPI